MRTVILGPTGANIRTVNIAATGPSPLWETCLQAATGPTGRFETVQSSVTPNIKFKSIIIPGYTGGAAALGLQTNLSAFWSLENTSWTDDTGNGSTLSTGAGTPAAAIGLVGNCFSADGSSYLSCVSNTNIVTANSSFSAAIWVNVTTAFNTAKQLVYMSKGTNAFAATEWGFGSDFTSGRFWFAKVEATDGTDFELTSTVAASLGAWANLVLTYNVSTKDAILYVNGGSPVTQNLGGLTMNSTTNPFRIGSDPGGADIVTACQLDQAGFWKGRVLSPTDITNLYNGGAGLTYAAMA